MKKKLIIALKKNITQIVKNYNAYLIHSCDDFGKFSGNDIDVLYKKERKNIKFKNTIVLEKNNNLRLHLNHPKFVEFLSLDIEKTLNLPNEIKEIFIKNFDKKLFCKKTRLFHLDKKGLIFYKLYKYFNITISSYSQLFRLKKEIQKLSKDELALISNSIRKALPDKIEIIDEFMLINFNKFIKKKRTKDFFLTLKIKRHKKRKIYAGKLNLKNTIFCKRFLYAFFFNSKAKWKKTHNPMPAIAIIGNDGSGKTTVVNYIRENFSKMDPLIMDMKSTNPYFKFFSKIRNFLKLLNSPYLFGRIIFLRTIISLFGEMIDLLDKYIKYRVGMAWADAGFGLTIFERYPTDRVRGEFPNMKYKFLPFEQFFPFPDGMLYLDVSALVSLNRKKHDNHTIEEMTSKRKNYLSLLKEFDEIKIIKSQKKINQKMLIMKNYIFELYLKKRNIIERNNKVQRVRWKKNFSRTLAGENLNRKQKDSFF